MAEIDWTKADDAIAKLAEDEKQKIRNKLRIARLHGATDAQIHEILSQLAQFSAKIRDAALADARKEIQDFLDGLAKLIGQILAGGSPSSSSLGSRSSRSSASSASSSSGTSSSSGSAGGGGSGGGTGGGAGGSDGSGGGGASTASAMKPKIPCIYVQGEHTVWAWDWWNLSWLPKDFASPIKQVKLIPGGLLAVAEHAAAAFDAVEAVWLTAIASPSEDLIGGDAQIIDGGSSGGGGGGGKGSSGGKGGGGGGGNP